MPSTDHDALIRVRFRPSGGDLEVPITAFLDAVFGSLQGTICFRSAQVWTGLFPGVSNGLVLTSGGPNADVYWSPGSGYLSPAFTSFAIFGQSTPIEVGSTIPAGPAVFTWSTSNSANVKPNSISIVDTTGSTTLASGLANTGTDTISISAITNLLPATQTWTINGVNTNNVTFSDTYSVNWEWRVYAGDSSSPTLTANQIKALTASSALQASFGGTYTITPVTDYSYLCYPDSMGSATNFIDPSTGFPISMATVADNAAYSNTANGWSYALVSVMNAETVVTAYRVYRTQYTFSGNPNFQMEVS